MVLTTIKETIELESFTTDINGNVYLQKRINLKERMMHRLIQIDVFEDAYFAFDSSERSPNIEVVVSPYPAVPTDMAFVELIPATVFGSFRYQSAGNDSVLFKANGRMGNGFPTSLRQFPSTEISSRNLAIFYSDHLYISIHIMGEPQTTYTNFAWSFMFVVDDKKTSLLTHSMGNLAESHDAMCALLMSNGHMITKAALRGNTFPMWRYGGIVGEHMVDPTAAGSFFLEINTLDNELMQTTAQVRSAVADARTMSAFDEPQGRRFPEWILEGLNQGLVSGAVRDQWPPIKHADNGNVRML